MCFDSFKPEMLCKGSLTRAESLLRFLHRSQVFLRVCTLSKCAGTFFRIDSWCLNPAFHSVDGLADR